MHSRFLLIFLCALLLLAVSIPGVFALWTYFDPPEPMEEELSGSLGVWEYPYTITFINNGEELGVIVATEDKLEADGSLIIKNHDAEIREMLEKSLTDDKVTFSHWMNAGSTPVAVVAAGNKDNIVLYPSFENLYTAMFVDQQGNILAWALFSSTDTTGLEAARGQAENELPTPDEDFAFKYWEVQYKDTNGNITHEEYSISNFKKYNTDVTLYPHYDYNGDVDLIPVDSDGDGKTNYYEVGGYGASTGQQELVEIPNEVNGIPVTTINADAFSSYDDLHAVRIPANIEFINSQAFTANQGSSWNPKRDTVTLYYEGDPAVWNQEMSLYDSNHKSSTLLKENWDNNMGAGSRVFFLVNGKVDNTKYWELNSDFEWVLHEHAYSYEAAKTCAHGEDSHYEYGGGIFGWGASLQEDKFTNYAGTCDCGCGTRPDAAYWTP